MTDINDFLSSPLAVIVGQPLRVAVYSRLSEAIHQGTLPLGSLLPKESLLGEKMGVSRTVIREALMLLEEDGLLVTRRGIGRFVTSILPSPGLENIILPENVLSANYGDISLKRIETHLEKPSDFTHEALAIKKDEDCWFCESLIYSGDKVIALLQEHLPAGARLDKIDERISPEIMSPDQNTRSVHAILQEIMGKVFGPGLCTIQGGIPGNDRGEKIGLSRSSPVMIITQSFMLNGDPFYLAKLIVSAGTQARINQPAQVL
ncbi:GntR family transcriptional regulator [Klebsiella aerogenes]|uniref:GntR family transcriptional regulator n=1 Tax=Klebsiella aerogenes TaxID=548 RepID=UPI001865BD90|nr:GntR family transcriptional regulator [Klebsiella aerogenes]